MVCLSDSKVSGSVVKVLALKARDQKLRLSLHKIRIRADLPNAHICLAFTLVWLSVEHLQVECFVEAATPLFEYCSFIRSSNRTQKNIPWDVKKPFGSAPDVYIRFRIYGY